MSATADFYDQVIQSLPDTESLTVLVAAGVSRVEAAAALGVDMAQPVDEPWNVDESSTAWAFHEIPGGVLAVESTGYGDPSLTALRELSMNDRAAAVVRHNIQAHLRFGCARDGELLFDDDEYMYIEDPSVVPTELRPLFDLAWIDLDADDIDGQGRDGFAVGMAMSELVTGVEMTSDHMAAVLGEQYFVAPNLVYLGSDE